MENETDSDTSSYSKISKDDTQSQTSESDFSATETTALLLPNELSSKTSPFRHGTSSTRFWSIFSQVLLVQFLVCFDATIMASSHPVITSYFGAAQSASWLSTAFLLTSTAFQPLLGRISDAVGRKPVFLWCLAVFAVATSWCGMTGTIWSLIVARAFCGLGAGGLMTLGNIITSDLVPIERRGLYQPWSNIIYGLGGASGAALGGAMAESLGWRWEFGVQVPVLMVCFGISVAAIPSDIGLEDGRKDVWVALRGFDVKGSGLLATCTSSLILGLNLGGSVLSWTHPLVIASFSTFAATVPLFLWVESHVANPIMPLNLIWQKPRALLFLSNFIAALLTNSILFNMPIFFRAVLLSSATSSGLRLMLPSIVASITSALTGFAITYTKRLTWPLIVGATCYALGLLPLCFLHRGISTLMSFAILIPSSLGQGFEYTGGFIATVATSSQAEQATVISIILLWRNLGMVLGIAASSLVLNEALAHYLELFVTGERKEEVIELVLKSVEAVAGLEEPYQGMVVGSYAMALRIVFGCCAVIAFVGLGVVLPIRLPRLGASSKR